MTKTLNCVMLVDDNPDDNFFHEREIKKSSAVNSVIVKQNGMDAIAYLKSRTPDKGAPPELIFLDINMPGMTGWEFLAEYNKLDQELKSHVIIVMLTTSDDPADMAKAEEGVTEYRTKPLTKDMLLDIINKHFLLLAPTFLSVLT